MKFQIGQEAKIRVKITDKMVRDFADLSGDHNPIHLDEAFAAKTRFQRRIAHGMLTACLVSRLLATELPGPGAVYLGQTLKFTAPVYLEDEVELVARITAIREDKGILTLETLARRVSNGELVLKGEATILSPSS